jgi:hypothetical protein
MEALTLPMILSAAGTAMSVVGSISQGNAQKSAMSAQAAEMERQREAERTRALQEEAARREDLASQLSTISAVRAGRGLSQTSPTALVIDEAVTEDSMSDMLTGRTSSVLRQDSLRMSAASSRQQGSMAQTAGYIKAGTSLLDFGYNQLKPVSPTRGNKGLTGGG